MRPPSHIWTEMQFFRCASGFSYMPSRRSRSDFSRRVLPLLSDAVTDGYRWTSCVRWLQCRPTHSSLWYQLYGNRSVRIPDSNRGNLIFQRSWDRGDPPFPDLPQTIPGKMPVYRSYPWNQADAGNPLHSPDRTDPCKTPAATERRVYRLS